MPDVSIFATWSWNLPLPNPFKGLEKPHRSDVTSVYNTMTRGKRATLHPSILRAVQTYMALERESVMGDSEAPGAIGTRKNGIITVAEYPSHTGELQPVVYDRESGSLMAARYTSEDNPQYVGAYSISRGQGSFSALFFALIPAAMKPGQLLIIHETSKKGNTYAAIDSLIPLGKGRTAPAPVSQQVYFDMTDPDTYGEFELFPDFLKEKVAAATNFEETGLTYGESLDEDDEGETLRFAQPAKTEAPARKAAPAPRPKVEKPVEVEAETEFTEADDLSFDTEAAA